MRAIQSNLTGVINETNVRGQAMAALIKKYLNIDTEFGLRTIGDNPQQTYPCIFVQPSNYDPELVMLGKYQIILPFTLYWYVIDNISADIVAYAADIGHNLEKLFSNNALNDLATTGSKKFVSYEPFWTEVMKFSFKISPAFLNPTATNNGGKWMVFGTAPIDIRTWILR